MRQVVNNDPGAAVHYKLTIAPSFTDITLAPNEQTLISNIWTQCALLPRRCSCSAVWVDVHTGVTMGATE